MRSVLTFTLLITVFNLVVPFKLNQRRFLDLFFRNPAHRCSCSCGIPNREGRLLGGEYLQGHEFPWLITILAKGIPSGTGVLINDQYVLTAASLLVGITPYDVKVTLGQYDACYPDVSSVNMSVDSISMHPDFSPSSGAHDLALLRISSILTLDRRFRPICLPSPGTNYLGQVSTVVGWTEGQTVSGQKEATCRPRKLGLPVLGLDECSKSVLDPKFFTKDKGCIGIIGGPSYICKADVGAPVTFRNKKGIYELIGILTDKNECGKDPNIALYIKINENIKWMLHNTRDSCYCSKS